MKRILFTMLLLPLLAHAQTIAQKADELLTAYSIQEKFSGNVLIAKGDEILFEKAYGYADKKAQQPNTPATEFRVGSLTKMFTSTLVMQLAAAHRLSLTDPVSNYVPGIVNGEKIQLVHLLSHTSGIRGSTAPPAPTSLEASVTQFKSEAAAFDPGSRFEYNNFNYILLSYIAQKVAGVPFAQLLQSRVLHKAGMLHSGLDEKDRRSGVRAKGYVTNPETVQWEETAGDDVAIASGAGALYTTTGDLFRWSKALRISGVLADSSLAKARKPLLNNYGLGWMSSEENGKTQIGHTGSIPGFIANFMLFPKDSITIVLLSNYGNTDGRGLSQDLKAVVFGKPYKLPVKKKAVVLSAAVINRYVGEYQLPNGFGITISVDGDKLFALAQGDQQKIELTPENEKKFYLKGPETEVEFIEEDQAVKYMFVNMQGGQKLTKVK